MTPSDLKTLLETQLNKANGVPVDLMRLRLLDQHNHDVLDCIQCDGSKNT